MAFRISQSFTLFFYLVFLLYTQNTVAADDENVAVGLYVAFSSIPIIICAIIAVSCICCSCCPFYRKRHQREQIPAPHFAAQHGGQANLGFDQLGRPVYYNPNQNQPVYYGAPVRAPVNGQHQQIQMQQPGFQPQPQQPPMGLMPPYSGAPQSPGWIPRVTQTQTASPSGY